MQLFEKIELQIIGAGIIIITNLICITSFLHHLRATNAFPTHVTAFLFDQLIAQIITN
jgi:hypothetical protein